MTTNVSSFKDDEIDKKSSHCRATPAEQAHVIHIYVYITIDNIAFRNGFSEDCSPVS
jgi:hypothetical protein